MSNEAGIIRNICISLTKGTPKSEVPEARLIADWGIEHDAHAGKWHRQISLLPQDKKTQCHKNDKRRYNDYI